MLLFFVLCVCVKRRRWLCGPQLLHPDSRDPSGAHRSVSAGAAEPADMKVESHQPSSTMFHTPALTGLPGGGRDKKKKKEEEEEEAAQTTLELCPVTVHQPSKVKLAELWERGGASPQPVRACSPCRGVAAH